MSAPMDPERLLYLREGLDWNDGKGAVPAPLVIALLADRDRLAAEVERLNDSMRAKLDKAYNDGWREGCGGYDSLGDS